MCFPAMGRATGPWSSSVTVIVVWAPEATEVLPAAIDERDGVATGAAKVTAAVWVTTRLLSVVSIAVYVTISAVVSPTVKTTCPWPSVGAVDPGEPLKSMVE